MRKVFPFCLALLSSAFCIVPARRPQSAAPTGAIEFVARVAPTAARPEPVRQFTFYLLSKSYEEITREAEAVETIPSREKFIQDLKLSPQLKEWMKVHDTMDLAASEVEMTLTVDEVMNIPEFLDAYLRANSGGVSRGIPRPKYRDADKISDPARYEKQRKEYFAALRRFIQGNPQTLGGMEAFLEPISPARRWNQLVAARKSRLAHRAPEIAQTRYLVVKADTDLDGRAALNNLPPGKYWLSTLDLDAAAGDRRLRWDVEVTVQPGQTTRLELTNLNAVEKTQTPP